MRAEIYTGKFLFSLYRCRMHGFCSQCTGVQTYCQKRRPEPSTSGNCAIPILRSRSTRQFQRSPVSLRLRDYSIRLPLRTRSPVQRLSRHQLFSRRRSPSQQGARLTPPCAMAGVECIVFVLNVQVYRQQTYCHKRRAGPSLSGLCNSDTAGRVVRDNFTRLYKPSDVFRA